MGTEDSVACRSYTHARRYPWVIGKIGGWDLPTQLSLTQLAAMGTGLLLVVQTRGLWAHLPRMANLLVEIVAPGTCGWATRHLRIEGRAPFRALAGLAAIPAGYELRACWSMECIGPDRGSSVYRHPAARDS